MLEVEEEDELITVLVSVFWIIVVVGCFCVVEMAEEDEESVVELEVEEVVGFGG